ncbi:MAG TPA: metallopeptidase TldD-related protein [Bryobacteraceae bacterium]|nr:metallopeptidase TldD-related protein [Bryobacteraceae bacterium]
MKPGLRFEDLPEIAQQAVRQALERGATDAECTISEGQEFSANVRMGEVETLKEAGSRGAGLRVLIGRRMGSSYTSDLTPEGIQQMVASAVDLAGLTTEDPHAGLPEASELGSLPADLKLFSDTVAGLPADQKIEAAKRAEAAALSFDARITNSEGGAFDSNVGGRVFANSRGFLGSYQSTYCSLSAVPVAALDGQMERDYWFTVARDFNGLESPELVGRTAAERVLRRLGAVKVETQKVPVVFEPRMSRTLLGNLFDAVQGTAIYRHASFLAGKIGEKVASANFTLIDDGTIPGLFGSQPFDDEGVPSRRTPVIEKGVLKSYLLNTYTARKLGMKTTGNASRGITGNAGIGHGNFFLEAGEKTPGELIAGIKNGFYVTELIGSGVNTVTGDYSRGAVGLWIRDGELAFPVSEVTIAGTLQEMLGGVEIANDLEFRGSVSAPTLMIGEMTVAGR